VIFVIGGLKLAMPQLFGVPNYEVLAQGYIDPAKGWISPFFAHQITEALGIPVSRFLQLQGWIEICVGMVMIVGLFTPMVAVGMGLMFWAFTVANPVVGEIRLSRDLGLMGLCFAVALSGFSTLSLDRLWLRRSSVLDNRRDPVMLMIRLSLAYPLLASALFFGGVLDNPLNTTLPVGLVFIAGVLLAVGVLPRWLMLLVCLWMLYILLATLSSKGFLLGLDLVKRELGFLIASLVYFISGPDRWVWPKPNRLQCGNVAELIMNYLENTLDRTARRAFEAHIADCTDCWRFLYSVKVSQGLREEDIPLEMRTRLEGLFQERLRA